MKLKFQTPTIIGALCSDEREIHPRILRAMNRLKPRIAFLPFIVERRYLKNTVACMKLMDVATLLICASLRNSIAKHITALDPLAKCSRAVDAIVRRKGKFIGIDLYATACAKWIRQVSKGAGKEKIACVVGCNALMPSIVAALSSAKFRISRVRRGASIKDMPATIIIDLHRSRRLSGRMQKYTLTHDALLGLFCQTSVEVLTHARSTL